VIPGEYGELVQASDEVPASSRVARNKYSESDDGERVHLQRPAKRVIRASLGWWAVENGDIRDPDRAIGGV